MNMKGYKTYVGILIAFVSGVIGFLIYSGLITASQVIEMLTGIGTMVGAIVSIYGRIDIGEELDEKKKELAKEKRKE